MTWIAVAIGVAAVAARLQPPRPRPPGQRRSPRATRRTAGREPEWTRFLDLVAADVRGGSSLRQAVHRSAELLGVSAELVLQPGGHHSEHPDRAVVAQALSVAASLGGAVAATVQQAANLLRERTAVRAEAAVHSAQARLSARVLTGVPLAFSAWSATADRTFRRAVLSPVGAAAAIAGLALNAAGWVWMRRLVRQAVA